MQRLQDAECTARMNEKERIRKNEQNERERAIEKCTEERQKT
jgi:hypothetical protein